MLCGGGEGEGEQRQGHSPEPIRLSVPHPWRPLQGTIRRTASSPTPMLTQSASNSVKFLYQTSPSKLHAASLGSLWLFLHTHEPRRLLLMMFLLCSRRNIAIDVHTIHRAVDRPFMLAC